MEIDYKLGDISTIIKLAKHYSNCNRVDLAAFYGLEAIMLAQKVSDLNVNYYRIINVHVHDSHKDLIINIINNKSYEIIKFMVNVITKIDKAVQNILLERLVEKYPKNINYFNLNLLVNKSLRYNILEKFANFTSNEIKDKIAYIKTLQNVDQECDICNDSSDLCVLPCHYTHTACKDCIMQFSACPYCRTTIC